MSWLRLAKDSRRALRREATIEIPIHDVPGGFWQLWDVGPAEELEGVVRVWLAGEEIELPNGPPREQLAFQSFWIDYPRSVLCVAVSHPSLAPVRDGEQRPRIWLGRRIKLD